LPYGYKKIDENTAAGIIYSSKSMEKFDDKITEKYGSVEHLGSVFIWSVGPNDYIIIGKRSFGGVHYMSIENRTIF
jgi:hypothetical protein